MVNEETTPKWIVFVLIQDTILTSATILFLLISLTYCLIFHNLVGCWICLTSYHNLTQTELEDYCDLSSVQLSLSSYRLI